MPRDWCEQAFTVNNNRTPPVQDYRVTRLLDGNVHTDPGYA